MLTQLRTFASDLALLPEIWRHLVKQARHERGRPERNRLELEEIRALKSEAARRGLSYQDLVTGNFKTE